jgi:L-ectoine synthase
MKVINVMAMHKTEREVTCPTGGFSSIRALVKADKMGFGITRTTIHPTEGKWQHWHYKEHLEACYCISGHGELKDVATGEIHQIKPGTLYALDQHDDHYFRTKERCILICVFNPPLVGKELHGPDGSYTKGKGGKNV